MFHEDDKPFAFNSKNSFIFGLVAGVLLLCTLGFFVLLTLTLRGGVSLGALANTNQIADANPAVAPTPSQPSNAAAPPVGTLAPVTSSDFVRGATNAKVTLVEYSDFQCPFCSRFHPTMLQLMKEYAGKVKWVYRNFPLSFHPEAQPAANAALCAGEQGKFWEYADALFANQTSLASTYYPTLATSLKLNLNNFNSCLSAKKYQSRIDSEYASGSTAGVTGTPGTIIVDALGGKQLVPGAVPYAQLKAMVDTALAVK